MTGRFAYLLGLLLIVVLVAVGCTTTAAQPEQTPVPPTEPPPTAVPPSETAADVDPDAAVVLAMVEKANAGDYAGVAKYVTEDFKAYFLGMPPTGFEFYEGKDTFQKFMEDCCTGQNFEWEVVPTEVENGVVYTESKTWMDFTRELGVAPNDWHEVFIVEDGKISAYWSVITEEALADFKPALCGAIPEACPELAVADTGDPVSEVTVTIENGTCAYDGSMTLRAGDVTVIGQVKDTTGEKYAVSFFSVDANHDFVDLMTSTFNAGPPVWSDMVYLDEINPGETASKPFTAEEGQLYMICWADPPGWPIGQAGPFEVHQ